MTPDDAVPIEREQFVAALREIESSLEATIMQAYQQLQQIQGILCRAEMAENDGLIVRYFENKEAVFFTTDLKTKLGFATGGG